MAWDARRPVPWARLAKEWVVYAGIMSAVFLLFFRSSVTPGSAVGLLISFPMYLALGAVLAKFGYQRASMKQVREVRSSRRSSSAPEASPAHDSGSTRTRPAPTSRTSTGKSQRPRRTRDTRKR